MTREELDRLPRWALVDREQIEAIATVRDLARDLHASGAAVVGMPAPASAMTPCEKVVGAIAEARARVETLTERAEAAERDLAKAYEMAHGEHARAVNAEAKLAALVEALGHPLRDGVHIPTQRLGMIPPTPCLSAALKAARGEP